MQRIVIELPTFKMLIETFKNERQYLYNKLDIQNKSSLVATKYTLRGGSRKNFSMIFLHQIILQYE